MYSLFLSYVDASSQNSNNGRNYTKYYNKEESLKNIIVSFIDNFLSQINASVNLHKIDRFAYNRSILGSHTEIYDQDEFSNEKCTTKNGYSSCVQHDGS